jgi:nucleoside-diphosphate-sugar epimerase
MRVLVTGGTGFVGSHAARQLLAAGHDVRLLVRSAQKARTLYTGGAAPEFVTGDITDPAAVRAAMTDCEAVVHAAAGTPMQIESVDQLFAVNVGGVRNVVGAALDAGIDRIICLSSITALFDPDGSKVNAEAKPKPSSLPYGQSKVEAELYLREKQAEGAAIAILYPGGVIGPDDPSLSDSCKAVKHRIENGFRIFGDGGMQYIDVRDLCRLIVSLVGEGGSGRLLVPGVYATWTEQADMIERVSGCELTRIPAKGWKLRLVGRLVDLARMFKRIETPISAETMRYATLWPRIENSSELDRRGIELRDMASTFDDTLRWMVAAGHLSPELCPKSR